MEFTVIPDKEPVDMVLAGSNSTVMVLIPAVRKPPDPKLKAML